MKGKEKTGKKEENHEEEKGTRITGKLNLGRWLTPTCLVSSYRGTLGTYSKYGLQGVGYRWAGGLGAGDWGSKHT